MRATRVTLVAFVSAALGLSTQGGAAAYVRTKPAGEAPLRWADPHIKFAVSESLPPGVKRSDVLVAVRKAAHAWSAPACTRISIEVQQTPLTPARATGIDGVNLISFHTRRWCRDGRERRGCYQPNMAAITTVHRGHSMQPSGDVAIREVDIELNAVHFDWSPSGPDKVDMALVPNLQAVIIHELGHAIGLDHVCNRNGSNDLPNCVNAPASVRSSVMVPRANGSAESAVKTRLGADDIAAVCAVYPTAARAARMR